MKVPVKNFFLRDTKSLLPYTKLVDYTDFRNRLKLIRESKGLEQKHLANMIKKERSVYTRKEKGETPVTVEELLELSKGMKVNPSDLLSEKPLHILSRRLDNLLSDAKNTPQYDIIVNQISSLISLFESQIKSHHHSKKKAS